MNPKTFTAFNAKAQAGLNALPINEVISEYYKAVADINFDDNVLVALMKNIDARVSEEDAIKIDEKAAQIMQDS